MTGRAWYGGSMSCSISKNPTRQELETEGNSAAGGKEPRSSANGILVKAHNH